MYTLKAMAIRENKFADKTASDFSETFVEMVEKYGRSFEFGLATRHYLKHQPPRLPGMTSMGLGMLTKSRMSLTPKKIKNMPQLSAILEKAKNLELS